MKRFFLAEKRRARGQSGMVGAHPVPQYRVDVLVAGESEIERAQRERRERDASAGAEEARRHMQAAAAALAAKGSQPCE